MLNTHIIRKFGVWHRIRQSVKLPTYITLQNILFGENGKYGHSECRNWGRGALKQNSYMRSHEQNDTRMVAPRQWTISEIDQSQCSNELSSQQKWRVINFRFPPNSGVVWGGVLVSPSRQIFYTKFILLPGPIWHIFWIKIWRLHNRPPPGVSRAMNVWEVRWVSCTWSIWRGRKSQAPLAIRTLVIRNLVRDRRQRFSQVHILSYMHIFFDFRSFTISGFHFEWISARNSTGIIGYDLVK